MASSSRNDRIVPPICADMVGCVATMSVVVRRSN
jgi:hypothetical protein